MRLLTIDDNPRQTALLDEWRERMFKRRLALADPVLIDSERDPVPVVHYDDEPE